MREIVFDTETTGLSPAEGHKIIEIGCVELINRVATGRTFHHYIDPQREIDASATRVHGITNERVAGMPLFKDVAEAFLTFVANAPLVAHNASFDINFLNHELGLIDLPHLQNEVVDTLQIARQKFPGAQATLDALCRRYEIDLSARTYHGALLDAQLLAEVYLELTGGKQPTLGLGGDGDENTSTTTYRKATIQAARTSALSADEQAAHQAFIEKMPHNLW